MADARMRYCYSCGIPVPPGDLACSACGDTDFESLIVKPRGSSEREDPSIPLPGPWLVLERWPPSTVVSLTAPPGGGKSSLASLLGPDAWLTSEQTPRRAVDTIARIQAAGFNRIPVGAIRRPDEVGKVLEAQPDARLVVYDSLSGAGSWDQQVHVLEGIAEWVQAGERRALVIVQHNKRGEGAGLNAVQHLVDACLDIYRDPTGRRVLASWKNRAADVGARYFALAAEGVVRCKFDGYSYSVEGEPGLYWLHQWPLPGAKWGELFDVLFERGHGSRGRAIPGFAGAGRYQPGYDGNVIEPSDVEERRRFAEDHGLTWWRDRWSRLPDEVSAEDLKEWN